MCEVVKIRAKVLIVCMPLAHRDWELCMEIVGKGKGMLLIA